MASSISNIKCFFCSRFSHYLEDYLEIYNKASVKNCVQNLFHPQAAMKCSVYYIDTDEIPT